MVERNLNFTNISAQNNVPVLGIDNIVHTSWSKLVGRCLWNNISVIDKCSLQLIQLEFALNGAKSWFKFTWFSESNTMEHLHTALLNGNSPL